MIFPVDDFRVEPRSRHASWLIALAVLVGCALPPPAFSQTITGTILGVVQDPSGSIVPKASVRIRNSGTNVETNLETGSNGDYAAPNLPTGTYSIEVSAPGFKTYEETGIAVALDGKARIDITLTVGNVSDSVKVVASAQRLQTDASDLNTTVSTQAIESLPNIGRNPLYYVVMTPGVVPRQGV